MEMVIIVTGKSPITYRQYLIEADVEGNGIDNEDEASVAAEGFCANKNKTAKECRGFLGYLDAFGYKVSQRIFPSVVDARIEALLTDRDWRSRQRALEVLRAISWAPDTPAELREKMVGPFIKTLNDKNPEVQQGGALALTELSETNILSKTRIIEPLLVFKKSKKLPRDIEDRLLLALAKLSPSPGILLQSEEKMVEFFLEALKSENREVRFYAAWGLRQLSKSNISKTAKLKMVEPFIKTLGEDTDGEVRKQAAWALLEFPDSDLSSGLKTKRDKALLKVLKDWGVQRRLTRALNDLPEELLVKLGEFLVRAVENKEQNILGSPVAMNLIKELGKSKIPEGLKTKIEVALGKIQ